MTILSIVALAVPSLFFFASEETSGPVEALSLGVAAAMILVYGLGILFSLNAQGDSSAGEQVASHDQRHLFQALGLLLISATFIAWLSEILVGAVEHTVAAMGLSEFFLGIIVVPLVGNVAEHLVGIQAALKNQMELSLSISIGSSLQVALFVAPILVFISLLIGHPLTLVFNQFELIALFGAALIAALVALDGESNWLEGAQLLIVYVIIGLAFFYLPV
jgi:Ca2+:H+ antiporter